MENGNYSSEPAENVVEAEGAVEAKKYLAENPDLTATLADSLANLEGLDGADVKSLSNDVEDTFRNEPRWGYSTMSDDEIRAHMSEGDVGKSVTAEEQHNGGEDTKKDGENQAGAGHETVTVGNASTVLQEVASAWTFGDIKQKPAEKTKKPESEEKTEPAKAEEGHSEHDSGNKEWGADIKTADDLVKEVDTFWAGNGDANSSSATLKQKIENAELQYLDGNISEEEYKAEFNKLKTVTQKLENVELQFLDGNISEDEYNRTREDLVGDKKAEKNVDADADKTDKADKVDKAGETDESGENDVVGETGEDVERVAKSPEERAKETIDSDSSWLKLIAHLDENGNLVPDSEQMDILVKNLAELYAEIDEENADVNENKAPKSSGDDSATKKVDVKTGDDVEGEGDKEPSKKGQTSSTANGGKKKDDQPAADGKKPEQPAADGKKPEQPTESDGGSHEEEDDSKERKTLRGNIVNFVKKGVMPKVKKAVAAALVACTVLGGAHVIAQPVGANSVINPADTVSTNVASIMEDSATDVASTLKTESESNSVKTDAELGVDKMGKTSINPEINAVGRGEDLTAFFSENKPGEHNLTVWMYDHENLNLTDEQKAEQIWNSWNVLSNDVVMQPQTLALAGDISLDSGGVTSLDDLTHVLTLSQNDAEFRKAAQSDCLKIMNEIESKTASKTVDHVNAGDVYSSLYVMNMAGEGEQPRFQYFVDREVTASHDFERLVCRDEDGNSLFDKNEIGGYKYNILKVAGEIPENASDAEALNIMRGIRMWAPSGECGQIEWIHLGTVANADVYTDIVTTPVSPETPDTPPPVTPEIPVDRTTDAKLDIAHGDGLYTRDSIPLENKDQVDEMGGERAVVNDHKPREGDAHDAGVNQETGTGRQTLAEDGVSDDSNPESKDTDSANGEGANIVYDNFSSDGQVLNSNQN